jgi:hypothetical protein
MGSRNEAIQFLSNLEVPTPIQRNLRPSEERIGIPPSPRRPLRHPRKRSNPTDKFGKFTSEFSKPDCVEPSPPTISSTTTPRSHAVTQTVPLSRVIDQADQPDEDALIWFRRADEQGGWNEAKGLKAEDAIVYCETNEDDPATPLVPSKPKSPVPVKIAIVNRNLQLDDDTLTCELNTETVGDGHPHPRQ